MRLLKRGLLYVVLFGALGGATVPPTADRHSRDAPADVEGRGFGAVLTCAACIMGGIVLAAEGPGTILVAARLNEFCWGPVAVTVSLLFRLIRKAPGSLSVQRLFTQGSIESLFEQSGLRIRRSQSWRWRFFTVTYRLFDLEVR